MSKRKNSWRTKKLNRRCKKLIHDFLSGKDNKKEVAKKQADPMMSKIVDKEEIEKAKAEWLKTHQIKKARGNAGARK